MLPYLKINEFEELLSSETARMLPLARHFLRSFKLHFGSSQCRANAVTWVHRENIEVIFDYPKIPYKPFILLVVKCRLYDIT